MRTLPGLVVGLLTSLCLAVASGTFPVPGSGAAPPDSAARAAVPGAPAGTAGSEGPAAGVGATDRAAVRHPGDPAEAGPADLLVRFDPGVDRSRAADVTGDAGGRLGSAVPGTGFIRVSVARGTVEATREALLRSGAVADAEPDRVRRAFALPNDADLSQTAYLSAVNLPAAWDVTTGDDGLVLAVLDSGIDRTHPDLAGRVLPGYDIVNGDNRPDDDFGHGTMVAGVAAARTNNGIGVAGATWNGWILPVKVIDADGAAADSDIANGIVWATDNHADVINLSLGGPGASATLQEAIDYAVARGVVVVAAAGNAAESEPNYPAAARNVIAVTASDGAGGRATFSNFGHWIDVTAPGTNLLTTCRTGSCRVSGTSFAAPLVSGIALLMRAADPAVRPAAVTDRLRRSARDLGDPGFDVVFGAGLVDAAAALRLGAGLSAAGSGPRPPGYWMLSAAGSVYPFGSAPFLGEPGGDGIAAADVEPVPSGRGYWLLAEDGAVHSFGEAGYHGRVDPALLGAGETVASLSSTRLGDGYWIFTTRGRVFRFGAAGFYGDLAGVDLNGPVLDSIPTPSGLGYYMVGADGGVFSFGDARFFGSVAHIALNAPVHSLVPDPDGVGYWLVAGDGGIFTFEAPFRGSMGGVALNAPVTGMVPFGNGYLMVATDGGIFNFSDLGFAGSLGADPPGSPVVAVAAMPG